MPEAVIVDAIRTPIGNLGGALSSIRPDDLAALVIQALVERNHLEPTLIEEVYLGCANQAGEDNRDVARMSALLAGFPVTVPGVTINRNCSSALENSLSCSNLLIIWNSEKAVEVNPAIHRVGHGDQVIAHADT